MLEQLFSPNPPPDPYHRAASHIDGAASILVGISGNIAMKTGQLVNVDDLFKLPEKQPTPTDVIGSRELGRQGDDDRRAHPRRGIS